MAEGDVENVMTRPRGNGGETKSDQAKCDARELVSELEFVWDQIKSNPPSTSSSNSQPYNHGSGVSPTSGRDPPIYPVMSEGGARNPGHTRRKSLRAIDPVSQQSSDGIEEEPEYNQEEEGQEEFVDAPDSQLDDQSPERPREVQTKARDFGKQAGAIMAPIAKYWKSQKEKKPPDDSNAKWQRRVESALIKMNAEVAAVREQLDMQHEVMMHSSFLGSFKGSRRPRGIFGWLFSLLRSVLKTVVKHVAVDAMIVAAVSLWMHYNNMPAERLEQLIIRWVNQLRQIAFVRRIERISAKHELSIPRVVQERLPTVSMPRMRADG
ncbi:MAG: hypothetical protein Q9162_004239 [Coniocarpon cinnabarinum]